MLRFLSPVVVTNECAAIWRAAMFAALLITAIVILPAIAERDRRAVGQLTSFDHIQRRIFK